MGKVEGKFHIMVVLAIESVELILRIHETTYFREDENVVSKIDKVVMGLVRRSRERAWETLLRVDYRKYNWRGLRVR